MKPAIEVSGDKCDVVMWPEAQFQSDVGRIAGLTPEQAVQVKTALMVAFRRGRQSAMRDVDRAITDLTRAAES